MQADEIICPTCGLKYPLGAKYCGQDGTVLLDPDAKDNKQCPSCRAFFPSYVRFCPIDSALLVEPNATPSVPFAPPEKRTRLSAEIPDPNPDSDGDEIIGKVIAGKYLVEKLLGEGGMAQVFKATHLGLDRPIVIKIMHGSMPSRDTALKRFEQESRLTAKIDHPNVVSVFDVGIYEKRRPYLVMEFIQGESLRDYMAREVSLPPSVAAFIMIQVCTGLQEAHMQGIVHRDLKPENIMLRDRDDRPDWVKIVDFGIAHLKQGGARLTKTGIAIGTVDYMSPEYLSDQPIDNRSDIYALGIIFFEMLAGRCPFEAETTEAIMAKHLWSKPQTISHYRPDLPKDSILDMIAAKALEKDPANRYQSVGEMKQDLIKAFREFDK